MRRHLDGSANGEMFFPSLRKKSLHPSRSADHWHVVARRKVSAHCVPVHERLFSFFFPRFLSAGFLFLASRVANSIPDRRSIPGYDPRCVRLLLIGEDRRRWANLIARYYPNGLLIYLLCSVEHPRFDTESRMTTLVTRNFFTTVNCCKIRF